MNFIICRKIKWVRVTNIFHSSFIFSVLSVFFIASPAYAAYRAWKATSTPAYFDESNNWLNSGSGAMNAIWNINDSLKSFSQRTITFRTLATNAGSLLRVDSASSTEPIIFKSEDDSENFGIKSSKDLNIIDYTNDDAYLEILSGTYTFSLVCVAHSHNKTGCIKLKGGKLTAESSHFKIGEKGTGMVEVNGGELIAGSYLSVGIGGPKGTLEISGSGIVKNTGKDLVIGDMANSPGTVIIKKGGKYLSESYYTDTEGDINYGIRVGASGDGTLNVQGGEVYLGEGSGVLGLCAGNSANATVDITDGGCVTAPAIRYGAGTGTANLKIDGGTIKAFAENVDFMPAHENFNVGIGSNGATIDTEGHAITIGEELANAGDATGFLIVKGGNTLTLTNNVTYSGKTIVVVGTTLAVSNATAKANILSHGLEVMGIPELNTPYTVFVSEEALAEEDLANVTCPLADTFDKVIGEDGKSIVITYKAYINGLYVGPADGDLSESAHWVGGVVPEEGAVFYSAEPAQLKLSKDLDVKSITFPKWCAELTISGEGKFNGVESITNHSEQHHVFNVEVVFAAGRDASITSTKASYLDFAGGVTMDSIKDEPDLFFKGKFTVNKSGEFTLNSPWTVLSGSEFKWPNVTWFSHNGRLNIESGAKVIVKKAKIAHYDAKYLLGDVNGEFEVTDEFNVGGNDSNQTHYINKSGSGRYFINKLHVNRKGSMAIRNLIVGEGGIYRDDTGYFRLYDNNDNFFGAYADWTIYHNKEKENLSTPDQVIYKKSGGGPYTTTFDTTDFYDKQIARTITCEAPIGAANGSLATKIKVEIIGKGKFVFANTSDAVIFSGGLNVKDSATVEVMANAWPGKGSVTMNDSSTLKMHTGGAARTGAITVESNATLEVVESGTVTLGGNLTLRDGATLAFNYTDKNMPVLAIAEGKTALGGNKNVKVKVSFANGVCPNPGEHVLTSGGGFNDAQVTLVIDENAAKWVKRVYVNDEGNLGLSVQRGFEIIVR